MKRHEEEFAIETAVEQYINRRQFSKFLVLTSLGMFAGNLSRSGVNMDWYFPGAVL